MSLVMTEYIEVNLVSVAILMVMLLHIARNRERDRWAEMKNFVIMVVSNVFILIADNAIYLLRGQTLPGMTFLAHAACVVYFLLGGVFCYEWVLYVFKRLDPLRQSSARERWLLQVPVAVNTLLVLASPATGWVYQLSDSNVYSRGPLIWVTFIVGLIYWILSTIIVLGEVRHSTRSREPMVYRTLLPFPLFSLQVIFCRCVFTACPSPGCAHPSACSFCSWTCRKTSFPGIF